MYQLLFFVTHRQPTQHAEKQPDSALHQRTVQAFRGLGGLKACYPAERDEDCNSVPLSFFICHPNTNTLQAPNNHD
ncbi:MAG: hypothetical protein ABL903_06955 [Methylococcales bacterium]